MSERKNIDKLFQEKFKDYEAQAPESAWPELERKLKKKKDRKIIPFWWWQLGGVAAALVVGFLIGNGVGWFGNDSQNNPVNRIVVNENAANPNTQKPVNAKGSDDAIDNTSGQSTVDQNQTGSKKSVAVEQVLLDNSSDQNTKSNSGDQSTEKRLIRERKNIKAKSVATPDANATAVAVSKVKSSKSNINASKNSSDIKSKSDITPNSENQNNRIANTSGSKKQKNYKKLQNQRSLSGENDLINDTKNPQNKIAQNAADKSNESTKFLENPAQNQSTLSQNNSNQIAQTEKSEKVIATGTAPDLQKKLDSSAVAIAEPNALEELLNEKENKVTKEPKLNRWQVSSNIAPIYFGSTSGGSPIDSSFANNSKAYNTQLSYGIGVNYAISKKMKLRTGVNKVAVNYDTNDVELFASLNDGGFGNLDMPMQSNQLQLGRNQNNNNANVNNRTAGRSAQTEASGNLTTDTFEGELNQRMGYIEVPLELSYAVIDRKFGVNVIAGVSTLFLNENKVILSSEGYTTDLGKANNLNQTHFSSNIGLGVHYDFWKSFEASFEPTFKYQLNTFSRNSGNFKPYFFGLYTGVSFRF